MTDERRSRYILSAFQWSLEAAVQDTLNEQEAQRLHPPPQLVGHPHLRRRHPPPVMHHFLAPPIPIVTRVVARRPPMVRKYIHGVVTLICRVQCVLSVPRRRGGSGLLP